MFEYQCLYEALRSLALNRDLKVHYPDMFETTSLYTYMGGRGSHTTVLDDAFGRRGARHSAVEAAEDLLQLKLCPEQLQVIHGLADRVSVINGVAGSGKSTLITALLAMFILYPRQDVVELFVAAPTRRAVQDLRSAMASHGLYMTVVATHLGVSDPDALADAEPAPCVPDIGLYDHDIVAAIDNAIALIVGLPGVQMCDRHRATYRRLLALRHEHLDRVLYSDAATPPRQRDPIHYRPPRAFLSTMSFLQHLHGTSGQPQLRAKRLLIVDDCHQCSSHSLMSALASFDCVVLVGDNAKSPPRDWLAIPKDQTQRRARGAPVLPEPRAPSPAADQEQKVLQRCLATDWLSSVKTPTLKLNMTHNLGPSVVAGLQAMSPTAWPGMTSATTADTLVFPFLFHSQDAKAQTPAEIPCGPQPENSPDVCGSPFVFTHAAITIVLELLRESDKQPVLCLAFFPRLLSEFRGFLLRTWKALLTTVGDCCGTKAPGNLSSLEDLERTGRLAFRTVDTAEGVTVPVAVLLALRRLETDKCWAGPELVYRGHRYMALTRATRRLYVFAEDLRRWVFAPRPATDLTVDIIRRYNLEQQLSTNGGEGNDHLVVLPADDTEFESQAEWTCLLWWLENQHKARTGVSFTEEDYICDTQGMPTIFRSITKELCPCMAYNDKQWDRVLHKVGRDQMKWAEERSDARVPRPEEKGSFYHPLGLIGDARASPGNGAKHRRPTPLSEVAIDIRIGKVWRDLAAIDALTVHVVSSKQVTVMIPINWHLFHHNCIRGFVCHEELTNLAGTLVGEAVRLFNTKAGVSRLDQLTAGREQHKQRHYVQRSDLELEAVQYSVDHPAFVGVDKKGHRMMYLYGTHGLPMQHAHQLVLIGRCESFLVAAALLKAVTTCLRVRYHRDRVRFWADVTPVMIYTWDTACDGEHLRHYTEETTIRDKFPERPNDRIRAMLRSAAVTTNWMGPELQTFLDELGLSLQAPVS